MNNKKKINKMKYGVLPVPTFPIDIYDVKEKSGSRREYSLQLSDELKDVASHISNVPLRFASLVLAYPGQDGDQDFHSDSTSGERAIVYLTDVNEESNGPIEFQQYGKLLGKAGTYVHYNADEIHRGCKSDINRYALALAFDHASEEITTIGGPLTCVGYTCPSGYDLKDPPPTDVELTTENCCDKKIDILFIIFLIFLGILIFAVLFIKMN